MIRYGMSLITVRYFLPVVLLFFISTREIKGNKVDSLLQLVRTEKNDTNLVILYQKLGKIFKYSDTDSSVYYNKKALQWALKSGNDKFIAISYVQLGTSYGIKGSYQKALEYFNKALKYGKKNNDKRISARALTNSAMVYLRQSDYDKALEYLDRALKFDKERNDIINISNIFSNIGVVYSEMGQYDKSIEYYRKALALQEKINDENQILHLYGNIAVIFIQQKNFDKALEYLEKAVAIAKKINNINSLANNYTNIGIVYDKSSDYRKAIEYYKKAMEYAQKGNFKYTLLTLYFNLALAYNKSKEYDNALKYFQKSLTLAKQTGSKSNIAYAVSGMASVYINLKQYRKALKLAEEGLKTAKEINGLTEQKNAYRNLALAYAGLNEFEKAYKYKVLEAQLKDSIFNIEKIEKINEIQTKYETEKKDLELANNALKIDNLEKNAERNRLITLASILILGLIILAIVLFYRQRLTKEKYRAEMFNQKLLRSQMNPHFIFNVLTSIQTYMFEKDTMKAAMYLSAFSKLTRAILDGSRYDFIPLQEDCDINENYLKIERMRHNEIFDYSIIIDDKIDPDGVQIAPLLIQPFLENSIKHGFNGIDYKGQITLTYKLSASKIEITVEDNGKGISDEKKSSHKSHAIDITEERLRILNKKCKGKITFRTETGRNKGFKVVFSVPLIPV